MACKGCAERREKIAAKGRALIEWFKNPNGRPPLIATPRRTPMPPLVPRPPMPPLVPRPPSVKSK
jgi:hypothetical protein